MLIFGDGPGGVLRFSVRKAMGGNRTWKEELHTIAVGSRLIGGQSQQVDRPADVDIVCRFRRELSPRTQNRRQLMDLRDLEHRLQSFDQRGVANIADEGFTASFALRLVEFTDVDSDKIAPTGCVQGSDQAVADLTAGPGDEGGGVAPASTVGG